MSEIRSGVGSDASRLPRLDGRPAPSIDTHQKAYGMQHMDYASVPPAWRGTVSLPSFASLESGSRNDPLAPAIVKPELPESTTSSRKPSLVSRPPIELDDACICSELRPLVYSAGRLIPGLNESANRTVSKMEYDEFLNPRAATLQSMQWVVDQLSNIDISLRANKQTLSIPRFSESGSSVSGARSPSRVDALDTPVSPRKRFCKDFELNTDQSRKRSIDLGRRISQTDSGYSQLQSPADNVARLLPSPATSSLLSYQHSAQTISSSSPTSITSVSAPTFPSTSAPHAPTDYVADLQHRITLKTMALQSLQAEHTNLLQQTHRESARFQASKKKVEASSQEINELLAKNEELVSRVNELETEVAELETRRDEEGQSNSRDREQWSRMLDMSGRLQGKAEESRQRLQDETELLKERIEWYEQRTEARFDPASQTPAETTRTTSGVSADIDSKHINHSSSTLAEQSSATISMYRSQVDMLRRILDSVLKQNINIAEKARGLHLEREELTSAIESALNHNIQHTPHL